MEERERATGIDVLKEGAVVRRGRREDQRAALYPLFGERRIRQSPRYFERTRLLGGVAAAAFGIGRGLEEGTAIFGAQS